ncbi:MAG: spore germination protein [Oscillospiraceae bacterium]
MLKSKFKKPPAPPPPPDMQAPVTAAGIEAVFSDCYDFETRELHIGGDENRKAALCFVDGLVSGSDVAEQVIRPLTSPMRFNSGTDMPGVISMLLGGSVYVYTAKKRTTVSDAVEDMLNGFCAIVFDGENTAVTFEVRSQERRQVSEPKEEKVVKGSKDAFVETIKINSTLVRRKLRNPKLKIRQYTIGEKTDTMAALVYLDGFTNGEIVEEAGRRLSAIKTEGALTSAVIEENLVDNPKTPFPQVMSTERPDKFCMNILEGRVGVLVDGLPLGYLAPGTLSQFMKVPEDHANHFLVASGLTLLRYISMFITLLLPAFYVAIAMYHQEMIPTKLMQSMIVSKQSVPFPTAVEVVMMLAAFELLQEAGLRLPSPIGETVSIIGALIVGQSAVEAKVVSPVVVVVIALAGIAGYTMPNQDMGAALRVCRFLLVLLAIALGMFGLAIGFVLILYHLSTLESFGVPYMTPFAGSEGRYFGRALLRKSMKVKKDTEPALKTGDE